MRAAQTLISIFYFCPLLPALVCPFLLGGVNLNRWPKAGFLMMSSHYLQIAALALGLAVCLKAGKSGRAGRICIFIASLLTLSSAYVFDFAPFNLGPDLLFTAGLLLIAPALKCCLTEEQKSDRSLTWIKKASFSALIIYLTLIIPMFLLDTEGRGYPIDEYYRYFFQPTIILATAAVLFQRAPLLSHINFMAAAGLPLIILATLLWPRTGTATSLEATFCIYYIQDFMMTVYHPLMMAAAITIMLSSLTGSVFFADLMPLKLPVSVGANIILLIVAPALSLGALLYYGEIKSRGRLEALPFRAEVKDYAIGRIKIRVPAEMNISSWITVWARDGEPVFFLETPSNDENKEQSALTPKSLKLNADLKNQPAMINLADYEPRLIVQHGRDKLEGPNSNMTITIELRRTEYSLTVWSKFQYAPHIAIDPYKLEELEVEKAKSLLDKVEMLVASYRYLDNRDLSGQGFAARLGRLEMKDESLGARVRFDHDELGTKSTLRVVFNPIDEWSDAEILPQARIEDISRALYSANYNASMLNLSYNDRNQAGGLKGLETSHIISPPASFKGRRSAYMRLDWESERRADFQDMPLLLLYFYYKKNRASLSDIQENLAYWESLKNEAAINVEILPAAP